MHLTCPRDLVGTYIIYYNAFVTFGSQTLWFVFFHVGEKKLFPNWLTFIHSFLRGLGNLLYSI